MKGGRLCADDWYHAFGADSYPSGGEVAAEGVTGARKAGE